MPDFKRFLLTDSIWRISVLIALFSLAFVLVAPGHTVFAGAIYKSIDIDGNVIFTDQPLEGAENISGEEPTTAKAGSAEELEEGGEENDDDDRQLEEGVAFSPEPKNPPKTTYQEKPEPDEFLPVTVIEILSPIHNTTLIDPIGKIWVELQSYPTPLKKTKLTAQLWMDNELITSGRRPMLSLPRPERGTHVLQVKLVDEKGRLQLASDKIHLHVKYRVNTQ